MLEEARQKLITEVSGCLRADRMKDASALIAEVGKVKPPRDRTAQNHLVWTLAAWCLDKGEYSRAAEILWGPALFSNDPRQVQLVWRAIEKYPLCMFVGGSSVGKSYSAGGWLMLDWLRDPMGTTVRVVGPTEDHLRDNLFTHLVTLHRESYVKLPGNIGDLFIGMDARQRKSSIIGVVIPVGRKASGRLQGVKRFPRRGAPHPIFGRMSRMRVFIDEMENVPLGIWSDLDNIVANVEGPDGFKLMGAFNPKDSSLPCGQRAEPPMGWPSVQQDQDLEEWDSKRGWHVVRIDPEKSENVLTGKVIYPGMQTREGLKLIEQNSGGRESAGYYTFGRGLYPPSGASFSVIPPGMLHNIRARFVYAGKPVPLAGGDLALSGGDRIILAHGLLGDASGIELPPSNFNPRGLIIPFVDAQGRRIVKTCAQLSGIVMLPSGNTSKVAKELIAHCRILSITPDHLMVDRTGHGEGVRDYLNEFWGPVSAVNYSESSTHTKITDQDKSFCDEIYDRIDSELWFAMKFWAEFGRWLVDPDIAWEDTREQLIGRHFKPGKKNKVEPKPDYCMRTGRHSPDEADGCALFIHMARKIAASPISMITTEGSLPGEQLGDDDEDRDSWSSGADATNSYDRL